MLPVQAGLEARATAQCRTGARRGGSLRGERAEFFERVRDAYLARAAAEPARMVVIDAGRTAEEVTAQILAALRAKSWIS